MYKISKRSTGYVVVDANKRIAAFAHDYPNNKVVIMLRTWGSKQDAQAFVQRNNNATNVDGHLHAPLGVQYWVEL
jgi:O-glycosyl hydrolase